MKLERLIRGYDKHTEDVVCEYPLECVPLQEMAAIYPTENDPWMYDCYPINDDSERLLRVHNDFPDLEKDTTDFFIECEASFPVD
ncbi:hypothetical protein C5Y96_26420 [Blastopirellula marina]|uniref:DUF7683 domain-containing protein n=1 Tax=Blastopirellula marina TaxID=124 RepID=A0A2S8EYR7_9BACT|nr:MULTISPECIES: hypothetical protein [Pirellulaceae]PQO25042.1 hypothetical protein C5Y96_26420 [Blastopirellula marina]RCS40894.1 hypothetical protein DTL36_26470 [Bremerella cremea]